MPDGEVGELFSRTPYVFDGYWKNPEKTAEAFRGAWCSVGDMARRDEDGYYHLVDRKSNMIISGGENIYPSEVERLLAGHPDVQDVAVVGVPDAKWGEAVHAVVVRRAGATVTEDDILDWCRDRIAGYKRPRAIRFIDEAQMPRTATGKIQHRALRDRSPGGLDGRRGLPVVLAPMAPLDHVTLDDKYTLDSGRVYLTGVQALVRLPLMQRAARRRRRAQHRRLHHRLSRLAARHLRLRARAARERTSTRTDITFQPGVNEDLAATALWGTQQVGLYDDRDVRRRVRHLVRQGPGRRPLDRRAEARQPRGHRAARRRAAAGRRRPRLPVVDHRAPERAGADRGDDPGAQSRDRAGLSRLRPRRLRDVALLAAAGSRLRRSPRPSRARRRSTSIRERVQIVDCPTTSRRRPTASASAGPTRRSTQERRLHGPKMEAVRAFARANRVDRIVIDAPRRAPRHRDDRQGLSRRAAGARRTSASTTRAPAQLGIRLYKVGMTWPLEPAGALRFADGLEEILVVEEKRADRRGPARQAPLRAARRGRASSASATSTAPRCCRPTAS